MHSVWLFISDDPSYPALSYSAFWFALSSGCSTCVTPGAFQLECLIKELREKKRSSRCRGAQTLLICYSDETGVFLCWPTHAEETVSSLLLVLNEALGWGAQTEALFESGAWQAWQTQSVSHSRLTGYGMSAVSQRWLTIRWGDKTCTYSTCLGKPENIALSFCIPHRSRRLCPFFPSLT